MTQQNSGNPQYGNNNRQYGNRQYGNPRPQESLKEQLEREIHTLEKELVAIDYQIDALSEKGKALEAAKRAHMGIMPLAIAQVALSTLGVKYLPPVAREWDYKNRQFIRAEENLKIVAISLATKKQTICGQLYQLEVQLDMLQYRP